MNWLMFNIYFRISICIIIIPVNAIGKAFASLGLGSSFFHGSETSVGGASDVRVNDLFGYIVYQEGVKNLPTSKPYVIYELSTKPR